MELVFEIENNKVYISFIPVNFFSLELILKDFKIKNISKFDIGYFNSNDEEDFKYYNLTNYKELLKRNNPLIKIEEIVSFFKEENNREDFNIYKLSLMYDKFNILYDDDSKLMIQGDIECLEDYKLFHNLYSRIYSEYLSIGYKNEW